MRALATPRCYHRLMQRLVPILRLVGIGFGVAGLALVLSGEPVIGSAFVAVGIVDVVLALVMERRAGSRR